MAFKSLGYGVDNIVVLGTEMSRIAFLMTHPSLWQQLQNACHASGNQTLLEWLTAAIRIVWPNQGDLPYFPSSWKMYAKLQGTVGFEYEKHHL